MIGSVLNGSAKREDDMDLNDRGSGAIDNGDPQTVTLSGREYERYLDGALNEPPSPRGALTANEWSPHVATAAKAMYKRLNVLKNKPRWRDLDIDATDHYCIAAKQAVDAFHKSASADIEVDY